MDLRSSETCKRTNVCLVGSVFLGVLTAVCADASPIGDVTKIMERSLEAGDLNKERLRSWVCESRVRVQQRDDSGALKSEEVKTYDFVVVDGIYVRKLITKNDKRLDPSDASKENQRVLRIAQARRNESAREREKRLAELEKKKQKERSFNREIMEAFDFKQAGEETIAGRPAWILTASPKPGYSPKDVRASFFPHVRGKIWIDRQDYLWAKAEADAFEPISVGFSLIAKLDEGAHLFFEQMRVGDGVWLVRKTGIRANARIALVKRVAIDQTTTYQNCREVPAGAQVDETSPPR